MRKYLVLALVLMLALLIVVPIGAASAKGHQVEICHVNGSNGTWYSPFFDAEFQFGRVTMVSEKAAAKHMAHGDGWVDKTPDANPVFWGNATDAGAVGNANCAFPVS